MTQRIRILSICLLSTGCSRAPSVDVLGSFFPVWMLCLTIGTILAFAVRWILLRCRLESEVGPLALFYPSVVVLFTCLLWLVFFR
jgi:YtcA family